MSSRRLSLLTCPHTNNSNSRTTAIQQKKKKRSLPEDITEILLNPLTEFITNILRSGISIVLFENEFPHSAHDTKTNLYV